jgi:formiminoglutamate deiminase
MPVSFWCEHAWIDGSPVASVLVTAGDDGVIADVHAQPRPDEARKLSGVVFPGFANAHSHAFHRALRGRTQQQGGTFWRWREQMYAVADRLDPDSYHRLARAVFAEMVLAGTSCVGEFHYLHHDRGGRRYAEPNVLAEALRQAAQDAGLRLTLLDTCYLTGGIGRPLAGPQLRFGDDTVWDWLERLADLAPDDTCHVGLAVHSVRAVPPDALPVIVSAADGRPLHVHVSEQPAENVDCVAAYGVTPTTLLADAGVLGPTCTAVHATHLTDDDVARLGGAQTHVCFCPTTERDLGDGIGPARALADAGAVLCVGTDQNAVVDPIEEVRAVEMNERLTSGSRGRFTPAELLRALTEQGHRALGWPTAGRIAVGAPCDLVAVRLDSVRTAGVEVDQVLSAATAADVTDVVVAGRAVVADGQHLLIPDVAAELDAAVAAVTG